MTLLLTVSSGQLSLILKTYFHKVETLNWYGEMAQQR